MAAKKLSELPVSTGAQPLDTVVMIQNAQDKKITVKDLFGGIHTPLVTDSTVTLSGTPETVTSGAISLTTSISHLSLNNTNTITLGAGVQGQIKILIATSAFGTPVTTLSANILQAVIFTKVGHSAILIYSGGTWACIGGTAAVA